MLSDAVTAHNSGNNNGSETASDRSDIATSSTRALHGSLLNYKVRRCGGYEPIFIYMDTEGGGWPPGKCIFTHSILLGFAFFCHGRRMRYQRIAINWPETKVAPCP